MRQCGFPLLREVYERREVTKVSWIASSNNIADSVRKICDNSALLNMIRTNYVDVTCEGWVDRDIRPVHAKPLVGRARFAVLAEASKRLKEVDKRG